MTDVFKAKVVTMVTGIEDEAEDARLRSSVCKVLGASALWTTKSMNSRSGKSAWHLKGGTLASALVRHELSVPTVNTVGWTLDVRVTLDCATGTCMVVLDSLQDEMPMEMAERVRFQIRHDVPDWGQPDKMISGVTEPMHGQSRRDVRMPTT